MNADAPDPAADAAAPDPITDPTDLDETPVTPETPETDDATGAGGAVDPPGGDAPAGDAAVGDAPAGDDLDAPAAAREPHRPLVPGDMVLLVDAKHRRYLVTLEPGAEFHSHAGFILHDDLLGRDAGREVRSTRNSRYVVLRPTLSDFILKMPRGAQVVYPKDIGPILMIADIQPGVRVLESGVGSGALSMGMLRGGADIIGYELREDFATRAQRNVRAFLGEGVMDRYRVQVRDCYEGIDEVGLDRIVLDLPEPWLVVPHAVGALVPSGILVAYTPQITQAASLRHELERHGFAQAETLEVMQRGWHIEGQAVRPNHRMVGHTGFLTHARLLGPVG